MLALCLVHSTSIWRGSRAAWRDWHGRWRDRWLCRWWLGYYEWYMLECDRSRPTWCWRNTRRRWWVGWRWRRSMGIASVFSQSYLKSTALFLITPIIGIEFESPGLTKYVLEIWYGRCRTVRLIRVCSVKTHSTWGAVDIGVGGRQQSVGGSCRLQSGLTGLAGQVVDVLLVL